MTSDRRWVLYQEWTPPWRIMRVPVTGGTPELLLDRGYGDLLCAAHGRCVIVQPKDGADSIWSLDPIRGRGSELARIHSTGTENVLPDGEAFAYVEQQDKGPLNVVRVISFTGKPPQDIVVQQATSLMNLDWLPSDSGFLTTDHGNLLIVWRSGASRVLWSPAPLQAWFAIPSPDETHLAIDVSSRAQQRWMLSGF